MTDVTPGAAWTTISTHVQVSLADEIKALARENDRSASGEIRLAIREHLRRAREAGALKSEGA